MQFGGDKIYIDLEDELGGYQYKVDGSRLGGVELFKRRNLQKLQDEEESAATAEFNLSFDVDQGIGPVFDDSNSGASSVGTMTMSLIVAAGALAMLLSVAQQRDHQAAMEKVSLPRKKRRYPSSRK